MKFSIIIPAKNELKNLKRTLPQFDVLKGKFSYEVILADGKSADGTIEFARTKVDRVEVKTKEERETIGEGRNRGAHVAMGDVLIFLDAGVQVKNIIPFMHTVESYFQDDRVVGIVPCVNIEPREATFTDIVVHGIVNALIHLFTVFGLGAGKGECQIIRRSAFEKIKGYNEKLVAAEDNDLMRRVSKIGVVRYAKDLRVYDDPARYRKYGYPHVIWLWILNQFTMRFFGKSYSKEWKRAS